MLDSLGLLGIVFVAMSVAAVSAIVLLSVMKDEKKKKYIVYLMAALSVYIAWANGQSSPLPQYLDEAVLGWIIGAVGVIGLLFQIWGKTKRQHRIAKILVLSSVVAGIVELFFIRNKMQQFVLLMTLIYITTSWYQSCL